MFEAPLGVDHLKDKPGAYEIQIVPGSFWVKKYTDGGGIKQKNFVLRSMLEYGKTDAEQNADNLAFFDVLSDWMEANRPKQYPGWILVEPTTNGYMFEASQGHDRAIYQIQCRLVYTASSGAHPEEPPVAPEGYEYFLVKKRRA